MLEFVIRPIRSVLGATEHDVVEAVEETRDIEANMLDAVHAIGDATASIEHHVEVIETLATSVDPLRASVDRLTDTMQELWRCWLHWQLSSTTRTALGASSVDTATTISQG